MLIPYFNKKGDFSLKFFNDLVVRTQLQIAKDNNLTNYGFICIRVSTDVKFDDYHGRFITYELRVDNVAVRNLDTFISDGLDYVYIG